MEISFDVDFVVQKLYINGERKEEEAVGRKTFLFDSSSLFSLMLRVKGQQDEEQEVRIGKQDKFYP